MLAIAMLALVLAPFLAVGGVKTYQSFPTAQNHQNAPAVNSESPQGHYVPPSEDE